jgi:O-antigen ligase
MQSRTAGQELSGERYPEREDHPSISRAHPIASAPRAKAAAAARLIARLCLGGVILLSPLRYSSILLLHPVPPIYADYTNLLVFPSDFFVVAGLVFWLASLALQPRRISFRPLGLTLPLAGLAAVSMLSTVFSVDKLVSAYQSARLLLLAGLYLMVLNEIRSLAWVVIPSALMILSQATVGILQVMRQHSLGLAWLHELQLDPSWNGVSVVWTATTRSLRAYGLTDHPNILGGLLALGLVFMVTWYLVVQDHWRPLFGSLIALGSIGLLVTFSRSAYLGLLLGLLLVAGWLWFSHRRQALLQLAILGAGSLVLLAPFLWQNAANLGTRFDYQNSFSAPTAENQAINERLLLIAKGGSIFASHPLSGVGVGAFPIALYQADPHYALDFQPPHLVLVDVAAETGILGALFYLAVELFPWIYLFVRRKQIQFMPALVGASAAILILSVISLFDYYPWMLNPGRLWQWLAWGLWAGLIARATRKDALHA